MISAFNQTVLYLWMVDTEMLGPTVCARTGAAQTPISAATIVSTGTSKGTRAKRSLEFFIEGNLQRLQKFNVLRRNIHARLAGIFFHSFFVDANVQRFQKAAILRGHLRVLGPAFGQADGGVELQHDIESGATYARNSVRN